MNNIEVNRQAVKLLEQWDPLQLGEDAYETETADIVGALQGDIDEVKLAKLIQQVYEFSFEQWIAIERCEEMAAQLLQLKMNYQCGL